MSRTVVSLVVNGKADRYGIAKATQERVRAAIRRTGYVPNMFVRDMFLRRREAVAVGQAGGGTPDLEKVSSVVRQPLAAAGYRFQVAVLPGNPADAECQIAALLKAGAVVLVAPEPAAAPVAAPAVPTTPAAVTPVEPEPVAGPGPAPTKPVEPVSVPEPRVEPAATREESKPMEPEPVVEPTREEASEPPQEEQAASESKPAGEPAAAGTSASGQASPTSGTGVPVSSESGAGDGSATGAANNRWSPLLDRLRQQRRP